MKKIYIAPETNIYLVHADAVMKEVPAGSGDNPGDAESKGTGGPTGPKIDWETDDEE